MQGLTPEETAELEKALARNKSFLWRSVGALLIIEFLAQLINWFKGKPAFRDTDMLYMIFFIWCCIASYIWFLLLARIKKDLKEQQKIIFSTKVIRKGKSDQLGMKTWGFRVAQNPYGVKFVKASEEAYLDVAPEQEIELSVAKHSKVYLSHRELS